jgi:hypothetical protein
MLYSGPMERAVRGSTKAKTQTTEEADKIRAQHQERVKAKYTLERPVKTAFKQKDLLMEALDTEVTTLLNKYRYRFSCCRGYTWLCFASLRYRAIPVLLVYVHSRHFTNACSQSHSLLRYLLSQEANAKWLVAQSMQETERAHADKPVKTNSDSYIRFSSRRGTYNTITFSMVELMPEILRGTQQPPSTGPQVCVYYLCCAVWCLVFTKAMGNAFRGVNCFECSHFNHIVHYHR